MRRDPLVLVPPSEGKAEGGRATMRPGAFDAALAQHRRAVVVALAEAVHDDASAARVLGCRGDLLDRARAATAALVDGTAPLRAAADRYTGVVWQHLGPLSTTERRRVLVPSALYGITTAADAIVDYRLKLSVVLPGVGRLDRSWSAPITELLASRCRGRVLVDVLPSEHARAIDWATLEQSVDVVHVEFRRADGGGAAGHAAKAAKGRFTRVVLDGGLDAARRFAWEGWRAVPAGDGIDVLAPG
jgi:hypothetical protein